MYLDEEEIQTAIESELEDQKGNYKIDVDTVAYSTEVSIEYTGRPPLIGSVLEEFFGDHEWQIKAEKSPIDENGLTSISYNIELKDLGPKLN